MLIWPALSVTGWIIVVIVLTALLILSYLLLPRIFRCCRGQTLTKGVLRENGYLIYCTFCCIIQHYQQQEQRQQQQQEDAQIQSSSHQTLSPDNANSMYDSIPDPDQSHTQLLSPLSDTSLTPSHNGVNGNHLQHHFYQPLQHPLSHHSSPLSPSSATRFTASPYCRHTPTTVLYSTPWVVVFAPRTPAAKRHLLIVPRKHIDDADTLVNEQHADAAKGHHQNGTHNDQHRPYVNGFNIHSDEDAVSSRLDDNLTAGNDDRVKSLATIQIDEEKELTSHQLLLHMMDVGQLLLNKPEFMSDILGGTQRQQGYTTQSTGGIASISPSGKHRPVARRWKDRLLLRSHAHASFCSQCRKPHHNSEEEEEEEEIEEDEHQTLMTSEASLLTSSVTHLHTPIMNGQSSLSSYNESNGRHSNGEHAFVNGNGITRRKGGHSPIKPTLSLSSSSSTTDTSVTLPRPRFSFHMPPFNSINHLHLHCFELPFVDCVSRVSFWPNTRMSQEATAILEKMERQKGE